MTTADKQPALPSGMPGLGALAGLGLTMLLPLAASVIQAGLILDQLPVEEPLCIKEIRDADPKAAYTPPDGQISEIFSNRPFRHEVTFNRKLNGASVSEALFRNAGTAPCSINVEQPDAVNHPERAVVTMTPQGKGTIQLALSEKTPENLKSLYNHDVAIGSTEPVSVARLAVSDHLADEFRYHKSWARPLEEVPYRVKFRRPVQAADVSPGIFRNALEDGKNWNPEKPAAKVSVVKVKPVSEPVSDSFTVVMKAEVPEGKERGYARLEIAKDAVLRDSNGVEIPRAGPLQAEQELAISPAEPGTVLAQLELSPMLTKAAVHQKVPARLVFESPVDTASITPDLFVNKHSQGPGVQVQITGRDEKSVHLSFVCDKPGKVRLGIAKPIVIPDPKGFPVEPRINDSKPVEIIEGWLVVNGFHPERRIIEEGGSVEYRVEFSQPVLAEPAKAAQWFSNDRPGEIEISDLRPSSGGRELTLRVTPKPGCKLIHLKINKENELKNTGGNRLSMDADQVDPLGVVVGPSAVLEVVPPVTNGGSILVNEPYQMRLKNLPKEMSLPEQFEAGKIRIINKQTGNLIPTDWMSFERRETEWAIEARLKKPGPYEFIWELPKPIGPVDGKVIVMGKKNHGGKVDVLTRWVDLPTETKGPVGGSFSFGFPGIPKSVDVNAEYGNGKIEIWDGPNKKTFPRHWGRWVWSDTRRQWIYVFTPETAGIYDVNVKFPDNYSGLYGVRDGSLGAPITVEELIPKAGKLLVVADTGFLRRDPACKKAVEGMVTQLQAGLKNPVLMVDRGGLRKWQLIPALANEPQPFDRNELFVAYNQIADRLRRWNKEDLEVVLVWCENNEPITEDVRQIMSHASVMVVFTGFLNDIQGTELQRKIPPIKRMECKTGYEAMSSSLSSLLGVQ